MESMLLTGVISSLCSKNEDEEAKKQLVKAVKLLEPLVQDLKRISFDEEGKESHEKKKYVKEIMRNCRSINDILGSLPEF